MTQYAYDVTLDDFQQQVIETSHRVPVLIDFWAEWCGPCRVLKPVLEKLAAEYGGRFVLAKINSDENQQIAAQFGVRSIPAVKALINGELADEFTGALPESQVRAFIDRLLPSPAEPLRLQAMQARARGDRDAARELLAQAVETDPRNETALLDLAELNLDTKALDEAASILEQIAAKAKDTIRLQALQARLELAANGNPDVAPGELQLRIDHDPADLAARLQLANALALAQDYRAALAQLLEIVRRDRMWQDEAGRKTMLKIFNLLGAQPEYDDLVREFRIALARILN